MAFSAFEITFYVNLIKYLVLINLLNLLSVVSNISVSDGDPSGFSPVIKSHRLLVFNDCNIFYTTFVNNQPTPRFFASALAQAMT